MKFNIGINFTNLTGAIALIISIKLGNNEALWPATILVLGRAAIPAITQLAQAIISARKPA